MYRVGIVVSRDTLGECIPVKVAVVVGPRHWHVRVIEDYAGISAKQKARQVRAHGARPCCHTRLRARRYRIHRHLFGWICRVDNIHAQIHVDRRAVFLYTVVNGCGSHLAHLFRRPVAVMDRFVPVYRLKVIVPYVDNHIENAVCSMLVDGPVVFIQRDVVSRRHNIGVRLFVCGAAQVRAVAVDFCPYVLDAPIQARADGLFVVFVVEHNDDIPLFGEHFIYNAKVAVRPNAFCIRIDYIKDDRRLVSRCTVVIKVQINWDPEVPVIRQRCGRLKICFQPRNPARRFSAD